MNGERQYIILAQGKAKKQTNVLEIIDFFKLLFYNHISVIKREKYGIITRKRR